MIISVLSSIIVWGIIAVIALRVINFSGISISSGRSYKFLTADLCISRQSETAYKALNIFLNAFLFRLIVFILEILILYMFTDQEYTFSTFLRRLEIWDCTNYFRISTVGYSGYNENGIYSTLVFFPLYPYIAKILNFIIHNTHISLLLTSFLTYSGGCVFLYKLCLIDYGHNAAKKAVIYASIFPFAFFFGAMMNESMLFFTSAMTLYFIRKHKWPLVGICGALAALSRMVGIVLAIPAAIEWLEHYKILEKLKSKNIKEVWKLFYSKGLWIFLMLLGLGIYLFCNYSVAGNWFQFLDYQNNIWGNGSCYFGNHISTVASYAVNISDRTRMFSTWLPYLLLIVFCLIMMVYGLRRNRSMYLAYFISYFILNASIQYPISGCRYMSCIIPLFIVLADFTERHEKADRWITVIFSVLFGIYLVAYLHDMVI